MKSDKVEILDETEKLQATVYKAGDWIVICQGKEQILLTEKEAVKLKELL